MLKLRTKSFSLPIDLSSEICDSFKEPLIFYLAHKDDKRAFFITFVILDFEKRELKYIISYLPENIAIIENHPRSEVFRATVANSTPHCAILAKKDESFLVFVEYVPYFFKVNHKENILYVYTDDDLKKNADETILDFSPTTYADRENPGYFYFYSLFKSVKDARKRRLVLNYASLDLSEIRNIHSEDTRALTAYHTIRKVKDHLINSKFLHSQLKNIDSGVVFENQHTYALFVYKSLYEEYCQKNIIPHSKILFQDKYFFSEIESRVKTDPDFYSFCLSKGKNLWEICKRNQKYAFSPIPGSITLIDLKTQKEKTFSTSCCAPAHFEIDEKTGDIFVSSHNYINFEKAYLYGPASFDRFHLENGELRKISSFSHQAGYRFASHRVFSWNGKTCICTFGQPNRLFFIDAERMELEFYEDIEGDFLSSHLDISSYINTAKLESFVIKALEVSKDGKFIFFISYNYIYFYSFSERKVIQKIKYNEGMSPDREILLSAFRTVTIHTNYLS